MLPNKPVSSLWLNKLPSIIIYLFVYLFIYLHLLFFNFITIYGILNQKLEDDMQKSQTP